MGDGPIVLVLLIHQLLTSAAVEQAAAGVLRGCTYVAVLVSTWQGSTPLWCVS